MLFLRPLACVAPAMQGEDVRSVQHALAELRIQPACGAADGVYGANTKASVAAYQMLAGLPVTGRVDRASWDALMAEASNRPPLTPAQMAKVAGWMGAQFGPAMQAAVAELPGLTTALICAIAGVESAIFWQAKIGRLSPADILRSCVFDASGDAPGTTRDAFPHNAAALQADPRYRGLAAVLIAEGNRSRALLRGLKPADFLYKGYGIFQYDLQNVQTDAAFFRQKLWGDFDQCLARLVSSLREKLVVAEGDMNRAVALYNGQGAAAARYAAQVRQMMRWCPPG